MAESQLMCMEDGQIRPAVPENKPEFYYSEAQRAAVEELLKNGDGAFKTRLKEDKANDFLSAREVKYLLANFKDNTNADAQSTASPAKAEGSSGDSGLHSTYWPQMSDTDVPPLDIGWPSGGFFRGVTRVAVHTHPPKDNGPHIKEVVRRMIQEASKVVAIVMDLLTDLHILQDLMEAASRRSVPVYILLDASGMPHFLDMCCRLQMGSQHLRNIRCRTLHGWGLTMSCGTLPGTLSNKYMLVDGDKVVFGSYSYAWSCSRIDRNMITVMTGQVVEAFDRDFRELYAISALLDLYKELNVARPSDKVPPPRPKVAPKRPPIPVTTSRFQMSLDRSRNNALQVPAHKYHNPKYLLALGGVAPPARSLHDFLATSEMAQNMEMDPGRPRTTSSERLDHLSPLPSDGPLDDPMEVFGGDKPTRKLTLRQRWKSRLSSSNKAEGGASGGGSREPSPTPTEDQSGGAGAKAKSKWSWLKKKPPKSESTQAINATTPDNQISETATGSGAAAGPSSSPDVTEEGRKGQKSRRSKMSCAQS
ncbi:protein FAM83F isoform X1 [Gadus morhua]|uniref:Family with sequence similarity 83 member Fb n=1 Tax=Gadus morhua TaxID=8049 RepID=A0A8C5AL52_GADMO|nr:protein FAM83F isoform X1 [Gadus morhua]